MKPETMSVTIWINGVILFHWYSEFEEMMLCQRGNVYSSVNKTGPGVTTELSLHLIALL